MEKEPELVQEVERHYLDIMEVTSMHGIGTPGKSQGWNSRMELPWVRGVEPLEGCDWEETDSASEIEEWGGGPNF